MPRITIPHRTFWNPALWNLTLGVFFLLCLVTPRIGLAEDPVYSFILRSEAWASNPELNGISPNTIFTYNPDTDLAEPASDRLALALAALDPLALVDGLSYGFDACCLAHPHGDIHYSVRRTATGDSGAIILTDIWREPLDDLECDLFWVNHVPAVGNNLILPLKSMEDNTASTQPVRVRFSYLPKLRLGLHGILGTPNGNTANLSNLGAFDHHPPGFTSKTIYFSIDRTVGTFQPGDILQLSPSGIISEWADHTELDLGPTDDINALSVDIFHSASVGQPALALYTLTRESPNTLPVGIHSAADVFMFVNDGIFTTLAAQLYRNAFAMGLVPGCGDIDSIVSIDPLAEITYSPRAIDSVTVVSDPAPTTTLDSYDIVLRDTDTFAQLGTNLNYPASIDQEPGAYEPLIGFAAKGRFVTGTSGRIFENPSSIPGISGLVGTPSGPDSAEWTWLAPIGANGFEIRLNDGPPMDLDVSMPFLSTNNLLPGPNTLEVRAIQGTGRSDPQFSQVFLESDLAGVENLEEQVNNFLTLEFTWDQSETFDEVQILDGDLIVTTLPGGPPGTYSASVDAPGFGHRRYTVVGFFGGVPSYPTRIDTYLPRPVPGTILQEANLAAIDPTGLTISLDEQIVSVLDSATFTVLRFDLFNLSSGQGPIPAPGGLSVRGVAYDPLDQGYMFAVEEPAGTFLVRTDLIGQSPALIGQLSLPPGVQSGDLCFSPDGNQLWSAGEGTAEYFGFDRNGQMLPFVNPRTNPSGQTIGGAVACRPDDTILAPVEGFGAGLDLVSLDESSTPRSFAPLQTIFGGGTRGIAWTAEGSLGVPSVFVIDADSNRILELAAHELLPPEVDCHRAVLGADRFADTTSVSIPDNDLAGINAVFTVASPLLIGDLDVDLVIEHPRITDLTVELISPAGTTIQLHARTQIYAETFQARFDDILDPGFNDGFGDRGAAGPGRLTDFDGEPIAGQWSLRMIDHEPGEVGSLIRWQLRVCPAQLDSDFERGDASADGTINISDAIYLLSYFFSGGPAPSCDDSADVNDDGMLNVGDAISILGFLFTMGTPIAPPMTCGQDPTPDSLTCDAFPCP